MANLRKKAIETYASEIGNTSLLTDEQERQLAFRIEKGDETAITELVEANLRFVLSVAHQYVGQGITFDDLVSEGNIGLLKAAHRYSPYPGKRFVKFAAPIVRDEIKRFVEQHSGLYKVPHDERNNAEMRRSRAVSVDAPIPAGSKNNFSLLNLLENANSPYADSQFIKSDTEAGLQQVLQLLGEREREVLTLVYGIGTDRHTMAEVGSVMGLKRERVRQIRDKALRDLRKARHHLESL